jgi:hypothetical protein
VIRRRRTVHMARSDKLFKRLRAVRLDNTSMPRCASTGIQLPIIDDLAWQRLVVTETSDFYQLCVEPH